MAGRAIWRDDRDRDVSLAWHVAMLERQKTVPPLASLLDAASAGAPPEQSAESMRAMLGLMSEMYGWTVTTKES